MTPDIKIMSDEELSVLGQRRRANQDALVDPVVVDRLYATAMHYRDTIVLAAETLRYGLRHGNGEL